jgi:formate hydrogenlyase transcriptional activator
MRTLMHWNWPGNIRELENVIERAVILTSGSVLNVPISELQLPTTSTPIAKVSTGPGNAPEARASETQRVTLEKKERPHILKILRETKGVLTGPNGAASRLGDKRTTLQAKMRKLDIDRESI